MSELERARQHVRAADPGDAATRERMLALLDAHEDALLRTCRPGHFTGSAVVMNPETEQFLLMFHTKLQLWLQQGGHADGEGDLAAVALREATEESGIDGLQIVEPAIDLDIHLVEPPKEDAHDHHDVRFLVIAPPGAQAVGNHESEALRWVDLAELERLMPKDTSRRMARRALQRLHEVREQS